VQAVRDQLDAIKDASQAIAADQESVALNRRTNSHLRAAEFE